MLGAIGNAFPDVTFGTGLHLAKTLAHAVAGGLLSAAVGVLLTSINFLTFVLVGPMMIFRRVAAHHSS